MVYGDFKDLARTTASDKALQNKAFNIAENPKYDGYQRCFASTIYKFFDKKTSGSGVNNEIKQNQQMAEELHKTNQLSKKQKREVYSSFKDNIWGADLPGIQLISKFNKGTRFLLCIIDSFSKYAWVFPLKDKKGITIVNIFQKILGNSTRKPNKNWADKGSEFYNSSFKMVKR